MQVFGYDLGSPGFSAAPAPLIDFQQLLHHTGIPGREYTPGSVASNSSAQHSTARRQPGLPWQAASSCRPRDSQVVVCGTDGTLRILQVQQQQQMQQQQQQLLLHAPPCDVDKEQQEEGTSSDPGLNSEEVDRGDSRGHALLQQQQQAVVLPGEVFSSPVAVGPWVVLGCRDDNVYCMLR